MITQLRNYEAPVLRVELRTQDVATHGLMSQHPDLWMYFESQCRDALIACAAEAARRELGLGPQAIERRDARERVARQEEV